MHPDDWERLATHFEELCALTPTERERRLAELDLDEQLSGALAAMLASHDDDRGLLAEALVESSGSEPGAAQQVIGGYRLLSLLGEGGMGEVWLAQHEDPDYRRQVALKRLRSGWRSAELRQRFALERQVLGRLSHRGIAMLLDGGIDEHEVPYLVLEYVQGEAITTAADQLRLSVDQRLELFLAVCDAVSYAHANLVVHRDLKPANILVAEGGDVRLLDFGIAKLLDDGGEGLTRTVQRLATPEYASPEQILGGAITTATDIYALGILLFELLTGQRPYDRPQGTWSELVRSVEAEAMKRPEQILDGAPVEVAQLRSTTPAALIRALRGDLTTILTKALQRDPERRYPSVDRLAEDLRLFRQGRPIWAQPDHLLYLAGKFARRHRGAVAAAAAIALLVIGFATYAWQQSFVLAEQRDQARWERDNARQVSEFVTDLFSVDPYADGEGLRNTTTLGEFLESRESGLRRQLADRPQLLAALLSRLARFHGNLGQLPRARQLAEEALVLRRQRSDTPPAELAYSLVSLATVRQDEGDWSAAEALLRESLALREGVHGRSHPEVAESVHNLAIVLLAAAEPSQRSETEALVRRAVTLREELFGRDHLDTLQSLNGLAAFLLQRAERDDLAEAEQLYQRILAIRQTRLGPDHPSVATVKNNLANLLDDLDREAEAIVLFEEAIEQWQSSLGESHPRVGVGLFGLAEALWDHGDLAGAERALRASLAIDEASLPAGHPYIASSWLRLGELLAEGGRPGEAKTFLRRAAAAMAGDDPQRQRALTALERLEPSADGR
ncbi:MAG: serine/threonine-protein kinase [Acidobacteriota bacterium]